VYKKYYIYINMKKKIRTLAKEKAEGKQFGNNVYNRYICITLFVVYKKIYQEREKALGCSPLYVRSESLLECKLLKEGSPRVGNNIIVFWSTWMPIDDFIYCCRTRKCRKIRELCYFFPRFFF